MENDDGFETELDVKAGKKIPSILKKGPAERDSTRSDKTVRFDIEEKKKETG